MNYKSVSDLNRDILSWIPNIPRDIDLIVGVPRSGLLPASLLALHLDLPLTDVDGLINKKIFGAGKRSLRDLDENKLFEKNSKVLIIDDSLSSGRQMNEVRKKIEDSNVECSLLFGAVYVIPGSEHQLDLWGEKLKMPRIFQWHLFHRHTTINTCFDIDGVLCRDPSPEENDDGEKYKKFIAEVKPNIVPSKKMGWLVTSRLEKYRSLTEDWLKKNNFKYEHLVMMDCESKEERQRQGNHGKFKAQVYSKTPAILFIESSVRQSEIIAKESGKPVLCYEGDGQLIMPGKIKYFKEKTKLNVKSYSKQFIESPISFMRRVANKILKLLK